MWIYKLFNLIFIYLTFYCLITPIAFLLRLMGRDVLGVEVNGTLKSYWIERTSQKDSKYNFLSQFISKRNS
jgi:hypothetical protein